MTPSFVDILVRVQWPVSDDPQNKALTFLHQLISLGIDGVLNKTDNSSPYVINGNVLLETDRAHGVITIKTSTL